MPANTQITDIRLYTLSGVGTGGDYHRQQEGHWLVDTLISNPMSGYSDYKASRTSWGIGVLGSLLVEIETESGVIGIATGLGGEPACWLINNHFRRFLIGQDLRNINMIWDQMYRASMFYGRKGLPVAAISAVDLALWDALGKVREEPVYNLIGGKCRDEISLYCTGPAPDAAKEMGFWGGKVTLPHGPSDGEEGIRANYDYLAKHRDRVGPEFPLKRRHIPKSSHLIVMGNLRVRFKTLMEDGLCAAAIRADEISSVYCTDPRAISGHHSGRDNASAGLLSAHDVRFRQAALKSGFEKHGIGAGKVCTLPHQHQDGRTYGR